MNNFNLPIQFIQMMQGGNPQQIAMNLLKNNNNPIAKNVLSMMNSNDSKGIEQVARNLCSSRGVNPDELMMNIKNQFNSR